MLINPFGAAAEIREPAKRSEWLRECRSALSQTASSQALECPEFDWLFDMLDVADKRPDSPDYE